MRWCLFPEKDINFYWKTGYLEWCIIPVGKRMLLLSWDFMGQDFLDDSVKAQIVDGSIARNAQKSLGFIKEHFYK